MSEEMEVLVREFGSDIQRYKDYLFGLYLFQASSPRLIRWMQKGAYKRTFARVKAAIENAETLLGAVERGKAPASQLALFDWPPWTPSVEERIQTMLQVYATAFPSRPRKRLTKQEAAWLREGVKRNL